MSDQSDTKINPNNFVVIKMMNMTSLVFNIKNHVWRSLVNNLKIIITF